MNPFTSRATQPLSQFVEGTAPVIRKRCLMAQIVSTLLVRLFRQARFEVMLSFKSCNFSVVAQGNFGIGFDAPDEITRHGRREVMRM